MSREIVVFPSKAAVGDALADRTADALRAALAAKDRVTLCLTGGSTPVAAYQRLSHAEDIDWDRVHLFWGDDRAVPADHPESNAGMAMRTLIEPAGIPDANVHAMPGALPPQDGADVYEQTLATFFDGDLRFDVLHLGMGDDGHTASLFPGTAALEVADRHVTVGEAPPSARIHDRLTLTFPALARADLCLVAAAGAGKRVAFSDALRAYDTGADGPPIARVRPDGDIVWLVDRDLADGIVSAAGG